MTHSEHASQFYSTNLDEIPPLIQAGPISDINTTKPDGAILGPNTQSMHPRDGLINGLASENFKNELELRLAIHADIASTNGSVPSGVAASQAIHPLLREDQSSSGALEKFSNSLKSCFAKPAPTFTVNERPGVIWMRDGASTPIENSATAPADEDRNSIVIVDILEPEQYFACPVCLTKKQRTNLTVLTISEHARMHLQANKLASNVVNGVTSGSIANKPFVYNSANITRDNTMRAPPASKYLTNTASAPSLTRLEKIEIQRAQAESLMDPDYLSRLCPADVEIALATASKLNEEMEIATAELERDKSRVAASQSRILTASRANTNSSPNTHQYRPVKESVLVAGNPHWVNPYANQIAEHGRALQSHASQSHASQSHASQSHASQSRIPNLRDYDTYYPPSPHIYPRDEHDKIMRYLENPEDSDDEFADSDLYGSDCEGFDDVPCCDDKFDYGFEQPARAMSEWFDPTKRTHIRDVIIERPQTGGRASTPIIERPGAKTPIIDQSHSVTTKTSSKTAARTNAETSIAINKTTGTANNSTPRVTHDVTNTTQEPIRAMTNTTIGNAYFRAAEKEKTSRDTQ